MSDCLLWGEETRKECSEYRDDGYNACSEYRDDGYSACSSWDDRCCNWWPCSWGCKLITWICVAWYWVSNWVCVAWYWVSNLVCVAWTYITTAVCLITEIVAAALIFVFQVLGVVLGFILDLFDYVLEVLFSIPFLGRLIKELWELGTEIAYRFLGLLDALAWVVGIRPEKRLLICVIILRDEKGNPVASTASVLEEVQAMIDIYHDQANIRVLPVSFFDLSNPFSGPETADDSYIHIDDISSSDDILDVRCGAPAWGQDLIGPGSKFNIKLSRSCFWGNARSLLGYGAPIAVFIVRSIDGSSTTGCSLGPLDNYVTVVGTETDDDTTIAHECGHSCGLWDNSTQGNLMFRTDSNDRRNMTTFQIVNMRNSKHVTYF